MEIVLDRSTGLPISRQIADAIRTAIEEGSLAAGEKLPTERSQGQDLGVDRMTVSRAYDILAGEDLIVRQVGRGSFVLPRRGPQAPPPPPEADLRPAILWASAFASRTASLDAGAAGSFHAAPADGAVNLSSLFPDPSLFPVDSFRRAMDAVIRREGERLFGYGSAGGYPPLRRQLVATLGDRGMAVGEDQIVVTNGSQQGIDLVARILLDPGDRVAVENPTYTGAVRLFHSHGARILGIPVDEEGMRPDRLEEALARNGAKLLYLIPNFQNPTSGTMSLARRRALIEIAARHRLPILEDDFGGDLRFEGSELPSLSSLDRSGSVIYLSTFAKKLFPGLRIGWLAAPREAAGKIAALKQMTDWNTSLLLQAALHEFCRRGDLDRHVRKVIGLYRERRDAMVEAMREHFPKAASFTRPAGGLVIWVTLPPGVDADGVALDAQAKGVFVGRGDLFFIDGGTHNNLRLVYAQASPVEIRRGIRILGAILHRKVREGRTAAAAGATAPLPVI
jgi:GntR family transcriptional regulator/MocR family aminotransferase